MSNVENTQRVESRGFLDRVRASPFLSELLSNRLAVAGIAIIVAMAIIAIVARFTLHDAAHVGSFLSQRPEARYASPSLEFPFGTDKQARNIFIRVLYGAWYALLYGGITVAVSTVAGVGLGVIAAYFGDMTDNVIMRTMDVLLAFPSLLLALALVAIIPSEITLPSFVAALPGVNESFTLGLWRGVAALTLVYTPRFARVVRGAALKVLEDEYIEASQSLGSTHPRVLARHVVPNCLAPITVQSTLNFGLAIIDLAALSFLGFGAAVGTPTWGMMLDQGVKKGMLTGQWWWAFFPGLFLAITVLGFNLLGDGMRDALDPRMRDAVD
ncbi:ABC transporter permease [Haloarchaeobius sp. DFWS5]|uniref:ABC transporter permease n=1 Tax=Haloarchaeobius sp. DFWS5 TaxID=3446114 RepID=UPI003EC1527D